MDLKHIDIASLTVSPANMRAKGKSVDIANILPSIRARGILVPLIVRAIPCPEPVEGGSADAYEIVAGRRRYHAALAVAEEAGGIDPLPCAVMAAGDDAAALEASLIENLARLDPDEVARWETFTRLVREGRTPEDIALTFGLTELQVKRTLALGNLLPRIRTLYRAGEIDAATVQHLTLASRPRQRDWLALLDDPDSYCPSGQRFKAWLLGGASISTDAALFDLADYKGEIVGDLFGEQSYFASAEAFRAAQDAAIAMRADAYREAGWSEVVILPPGDTFHLWEHERRPKRKGGRVYAATGHDGSVMFHEGYVTAKEARRLEKGESIAKPARPEVTAAINDYIDLHRHAAVRAELAAHPALALRVALAHMIAGSPLWTVRIEPQRAANDAVAESVESSAAEAAFDAKRRAILALLGFDPETPTVTGGHDGEHGLAGLLGSLLRLADGDVLATLAIVMGETLDARSVLVDMLGAHLTVDMAKAWQADDALLDLIRDREVLGAIVAEVACDAVAKANAGETAKVQRQIVRDCLGGTNGRQKAEGWVPRWMAFPASAYTTRGGVGSVCRTARAAEAMSPVEDADTGIEPVREAA